ncbi:MAG: DNA cytosine methyltransferase [PVC group bacterium]|nr:DNA cytosine methyltransferase [PVC group bacterium]
MKKVLNLYAGIGGNRKLWEGVEVTAVELNPEIAEIYKDLFPDDTVVVDDAHDFLLKNYKDYDFIWSSPPCQSHSDIRRMGAIAEMYDAVFPDMNLWGEIVFLKHFYKGKYVVENVKPYYKPFVEPSEIIDRHCFWSNYSISNSFQKSEKFDIRKKGSKGFGFDISGYKIKHRKDQIIRNLVNPDLGLHIYNCAFDVHSETEARHPCLFDEANNGI